MDALSWITLIHIKVLQFFPQCYNVAFYDYSKFK